MTSSINHCSYSSSKESKPNSFSVMDPTDDSIFTAGVDDVSSMSKILQELHHADDQSVLVINKNGIQLITAGEKTFQVSAYFAASTFQRFKFDSDNHNKVNFRFILRDFIESLNLLRDDPIVEGDRFQPQDDGQQNDLMKTSLYIQYRKKGDPLRMRLENKSNYVINCDLRAFNLPSDTMFSPLTFSESEETAVILVSSKKFYEYVSGLDLVSSEYVQLVMGRGETPIKLSTRSPLGEVVLEVTSNETDIIKREMVVSDNCLFSFNYKTQFIKPALEALRTSVLMQMKCGSNGLLCIEHFHPVDRPTRDGPFLRPDNGLLMPSQSSMEIMTDYNQPQNKRSSVEYFILSEAKPSDLCPD